MCMENGGILGSRTSAGIATANPHAETAQHPQYGRPVNMLVIPEQECGWLDEWPGTDKISMRPGPLMLRAGSRLPPVIPSRPCLATIPGRSTAGETSREASGHPAHPARSLNEDVHPRRKRPDRDGR
ncbi:uncharacterized protein TrAtP1_003203 [Trichoderma atroviride]|uniref:uncharacterized protein n=1 Tax=Hypocrea atroviridis TaxID=63577 RepID=UPI00331A8CC8|nr:hypothetical protein TrAtP1_003203 [Trichoderma atroviride]